MIRSLDYVSGRVARAFLSDRYRRIGNLRIAMAILPLFMGNDQYEVMSSKVTENRMYIKISFRMKRYEIVPGDRVEFGIIISNSEVGLGAVVVRPFLNRLICTNGCVVNDFGERRHHVGRQAKAMEDSFDLYSDTAIEAEDKAFMLKLQDVAKATLDESRYPTIIGKLQDSTRASQDFESYDRATELESIGWGIVTMEPARWKEKRREQGGNDKMSYDDRCSSYDGFGADEEMYVYGQCCENCRYYCGRGEEKHRRDVNMGSEYMD